MSPRGSHRDLNIWMNGHLVGSWRIRARQHEFEYDPAWLDSPFARPISLSMPLRPRSPYRGQLVHSFFDNLLPDSNPIRQRLQANFKTDTTEAFDLLWELGRDCVGAIQLLPMAEQPQDLQTIQGAVLSDDAIERILATTVANPLGANPKDFRISLAGVHDKSAFLRHEGAWMRPLGSTPTTHIFKLPIGPIGLDGIDLSFSVENEWLCLRLLKEVGLPVADSEMATFGSKRVLIVTRFDRSLAPTDDWIVRRPQEDLCQATATPPGKKYEVDGGPGIGPIMDLLLGSTTPMPDRECFFLAQIMFWVLCAIDGHAKNFSLFLEPRGRYRLAPIYDVLSAYPILGHGVGRYSRPAVKLAMAFWGRNRHYTWTRVAPRHFLSTALSCGMEENVTRGLLERLLASLPSAVERVKSTLPAGFPEPVAGPIFAGLGEQIRKIEDFLSQPR